MPKRLITVILLGAFLASSVTPLPLAEAQTVLALPAPGTMVMPTPDFAPAIMKGIKVFPDNPLRFDFIIDTGNTTLSAPQFEKECARLTRYFLASLTIPEKDKWVNLSPYENDRIIPQDFGVTEMGRDLLAQDYLLKQLSASLLYPEKELGSKFWQRVRRKAEELYGTSEIPVNTFNKVWVVPDSATVYENNGVAFIAGSRLKVMLESDYLARSQGHKVTKSPPGGSEAQDAEISAQMIREIIVPEIEREVNEGEHFTQLRQIYHAMILATWFKRSLKDSLLGQIYVEQNKVAGVDIADKEIAGKIYRQYLQAFEKGVYSYIKEEYDEVSRQMIPRKYFSGGYDFGDKAMLDAVNVEQKGRAALARAALSTAEGELRTVMVVGNPVEPGADRAALGEASSGTGFGGIKIEQWQKNAIMYLAQIKSLSQYPDRAGQIAMLENNLVSLGEKATPLLMERFRNGDSYAQKRSILRVLAGIKDPGTTGFLLSLLAESPNDTELGGLAAAALGQIGPEHVSPGLRQLLAGRGPEMNILTAVSEVGDKNFVPALKEELRTEDKIIKEDIARTLIDLEEKEGLVALVELIESAVAEARPVLGEGRERTLSTYLGTLLEFTLLSEKNKPLVRNWLRNDEGLEKRLSAAAGEAATYVREQAFLKNYFIDALSLGRLSSTAEILWDLYQNEPENSPSKERLAAAMRDVGPASLPYLTRASGQDALVYQALGDIGNVLVVPFLIRKSKETEERDIRSAIAIALQKIGESSLPYLLDALKTEREENAYITDILSAFNSPAVVPALTGLLDAVEPKRNRLNIFETLMSQELRFGAVTRAFDQDALLRDKIYTLALAHLEDGLADKDYEALRAVLEASAAEQDVPGLLDIYEEGGMGVKRAVLGALSSRTGETAFSFLAVLLSSRDQLIVGRTLGALSSWGKSGALKEQLLAHPDMEGPFVGNLEKLQGLNNPVIDRLTANVLGLSGAKRGPAVLIRELERRLREGGVPEKALLEALMQADGAREELLSRHGRLVEEVNDWVTRTLLSGYSRDENMEETKDILAGTFVKWLEFVDEEKALPGPEIKGMRVSGVDEYFSQRERITDLILRLKGTLGQNPDLSYQKIMALIEKSLRSLDVRARARFRAGVIQYVRDRERVRLIKDMAGQAGIQEGEWIEPEAPGGEISFEKIGFLSNITGFLPKRAKVFFLSDTVHLVLDEDSYGRMKRREVTSVQGENDGWNQLTEQEKGQYLSSAGTFNLTWDKSVEGVRLNGILTFGRELFTPEEEDMIKTHEVEHRFFHGYARQELAEEQERKRAEVDRLIEAVNSQDGQEKARTERRLINAAAQFVLFSFQDEMMAKISDGRWIMQRDISSWYNFYREHHRGVMTRLLHRIVDFGTLNKVSAGAFDRTEKILKEHKPRVDRIIELRAALEGAEYSYSSLKAANEWTATFLQTIPVDRFQLLDLEADRMASRLRGSEEQTRDRAQITEETKRDQVGGIDLNEKFLDLRTEGQGADFDFPVNIQNLQTLPIEGLNPVILQIAPTNLPLFLGSAAEDAPTQLTTLL